MNLLQLIVSIPIFTVILILFTQNKEQIKCIALTGSLLNFLLSLQLWIFFDNSSSYFQYSFDLWAAFLGLAETLEKVAAYFQYSFELSAALALAASLGWSETALLDLWAVLSAFLETASEKAAAPFSFTLGVDGISIFFIILSTFLIPICILSGWKSIAHGIAEYCISLLILESLLIIVFTVSDLLLFYVFFESVLIPMFIIIGVWGSRERKIGAAYAFFLYTLAGSVCMLLAILLIYFQTGSTDLQILYSGRYTETRGLFLWAAFFVSFAVKVPMVPVHIWLPEAHVEAPTAGSVLLAGIMLKLGGYGFLRWNISLFPDASIYFTPFVYTISIIAIIYTSLTTIRQIDLKKIIAYSSVAHMNFVTIGIFSYNTIGIEGSILLMISHGLVSPALFLAVGCLYDRHKTRYIRYIAGTARTMPLFAIFFLFFTMANISLPGTSSFVGEFLILTATYQTNSFVAVAAASGMVLGGGYALWLCNRLLYGVQKTIYIRAFSDLSRREFLLFVPFVISTFLIGFYPDPFLQTIHCSVSNLIESSLLRCS